MRRLLIPFIMATTLALSATGTPQVLPLWEGTPPNHQTSELVEVGELRDTIFWYYQVQHPTIEVRRPSVGAANGQAVIVCPGGGYWGLAYDWEGTDTANWLNSIGVTAIVLKYRTPEDVSNVKPWLSPLLDAQRAIRLTRAHAAEWGIDPTKVGIMGFSAGGHLASTAATHFDAGDPGAADPVDRLSSRPDFAILIYPVISMEDGVTHGGSRTNLLGEAPTTELIEHYSNDLQVTADTPPTFLLHASDDDAVPVENSLRFYRALIAHGVSAEMHLYPTGGHGFALAIGKGHLQGWTARCADWLATLSQE
ncbi:alpha/beta hydrolase [Actomonas aquatica]|uniref:Alpha/beta hydrolase n=1 Tax=Actomonas aquatica TaxID=2866162 RepID=A0ABZ1C3N5_9BACT|nr:alpha/beta hydrolase [Opitutus sp. WL0086]WRQ86215.1 alpha/beta hydrolase [Opitutus sp. WL0086]